MNAIKFALWHAHVPEQLDRQIAGSADPGLIALREKVAADPGRILISLIPDITAGQLSFVATIAIIGFAGGVMLPLLLGAAMADLYIQHDRAHALVG